MFVGGVKITSEMMANWKNSLTPEEQAKAEVERLKRYEDLARYLESYDKFAKAYPELANGVVADFDGKTYGSIND